MHYHYRHGLDGALHYPELDGQGQRILRAAFEVAEEAHRGQSRKKIDPAIGYITHPILTCDILYRMGERDPLLLASALLHDAIEDHSEFRKNPNAFVIKLVLALRHEFHGELLTADSHDAAMQTIDIAANQIASLCTQVTNPKFLPEGKEVEQISRMAVTTDANVIKLKTADQLASIICNLTMANDPQKFSLEQEQKFLEKVHTLMVAMYSTARDASTEQTLRGWESFAGRILNAAHQLFDFPLDADRAAVDSHRRTIRKEFDYERPYTSETVISLRRMVVPVAGSLPIDRGDIVKKPENRIGVGRIDFNREGFVTGYVLWTSTDRSAQEANRVQDAITEGLRTMRRAFNSYVKGDVTTRALVQPEDRMQLRNERGRVIGIGRYYLLSPPLPTAAFISAVRPSDKVIGEQERAILAFAEVVKQQPQAPIADLPSETEPALETERVPSWIHQKMVHNGHRKQWRSRVDVSENDKGRS